MGAHVFEDGKLVGATPTSLEDLDPAEVLVFRAGFVPALWDSETLSETVSLTLTALPEPARKRGPTLPLANRLQAWRHMRDAIRAAHGGDCAVVKIAAELVQTLDPSLHRLVLSRELAVAGCLDVASTRSKP